MNDILIAKNEIYNESGPKIFYQPIGSITNIITQEDICSFWINFIGINCHPDNRNNFNNFIHTSTVCRLWSIADYYLATFVEKGLVSIDDAINTLKLKYGELPLDRYFYGPGDLELFNIAQYEGEPFELSHSYYSERGNILTRLLRNFSNNETNVSGPKYKIIEEKEVYTFEDLVLIDHIPE